MEQYRSTLNALMAHAIKVAKGKIDPPQLFVPTALPPLNFKKKPVSADDKVNFRNAGEAIIRTDPLLSAFQSAQGNELRQIGFNIGIGATGQDTLWGPGKQKILDSIDFEQQIGFRQASSFAMIRNNEPVLASKRRGYCEG